MKHENDRELLRYWLQQREDAERAVEVANQQIEKLTMFMILKTLDEPDGEGTTDTKME